MNEIIKKRFFTQLTITQLYLMVGNFLLIFFLIFLSNLCVLPLKNISDFLFFTFLFLFFALYRPGWAFLLFVGTIALENINLAPASFGIAVRPYQFSGALVILAMLIRLVAKRLNFSLEKPKWHDLLVILITAGGFVSALTAPDRVLSFKLSVIFATFAALYFLVRNYIRDIMDLKKIIPFFLSSSLIIILYGIWQNIRFIGGLTSFEVMPGRPNGTFPEADWLGIYVVLFIALVYAIIFFVIAREHSDRGNLVPITTRLLRFARKDMFLYIFLTLNYILLILTVSRSAWLGALAATFVFLFIILTNLKINPKDWQWKKLFWNSFGILISGIIAIAIVYFFNLTSFQLFNRAQSIGTGLQKITISCSPRAKLLENQRPSSIGDVSELKELGCRYINFEEIKLEEARGNFIKETYRDDPNVNIRKEIYKKSWQEIKKNPILGIGWGSIGKALGTDERGASLNASNIFLEVWLGTGLIGLVAFLLLWFYILFRNSANFIKTKDLEERAFSIFIITAWFGLTAANLFNSGIMLGFLWVFIAVSLIEIFRTNSE